MGPDIEGALPLANYTVSPPDPQKWRRHESDIEAVMPSIADRSRALKRCDALRVHVVTGGGMALIRAQKTLDKSRQHAEEPYLSKVLLLWVAAAAATAASLL